MTTDKVFYIDGKQYPLERSPEKVSTLLHLVSTTADEVLLVSLDGIEYGDPRALVEIAPNSKFTTKKRTGDRKPLEDSITYKVNGEESTTNENPISVETILREAGAGAAIDVADLDSYFLENTVTGKKYENLKDLVQIKEGDNFLAIHAGSTPVAQT